jgi:hypothetical protein
MLSRGSLEESLSFGLDQAMEALPILALSKSHVVEHALCCLEIGHLYVLLSEFPEDFSLREQVMTYLERVLTLSITIAETMIHIGQKWQIYDRKTYPVHIALLLEEYDMHY